MRHLKTGRKFGRNSSHRKAMFSNMCASLFMQELIKTTLAKAKEMRSQAEQLITLAKVDSVHNRRRAFAILRDKAAVGKLFTILGKRYAKRPGGYLRVIKCGFRPGDNAPMAYVELVDRGLEVVEEVKQNKPKAASKKSPAEKAEQTEAKKPVKPKEAEASKAKPQKKEADKGSKADDDSKVEDKPA